MRYYSTVILQAFKVLINGPQATDLLCLRWRMFFHGQETKKIRIEDEADIIEEALLYYKHPLFDPTTPIRISFKFQPAVDTGGVTRKFFTDVLHKFACHGDFQMFVGPKERLRPAYSPQVLPIMKILGTIIAHSLLHEGPGFPHFAPFVYWYLATGCIQRALPYVSINDDLSENTATVVKKVREKFWYCCLRNFINNSNVSYCTLVNLQ